MTMKEHLDKLTQEKEIGVKLTAEEADARKKEIAKEATAVVASFVFTAKMLVTAINGIKEHLEHEHAMCKKCMEIIDTMYNEDVKAE